MARLNPNRLLVEGDEGKRVIPYFMEHFIAWGNAPETRPVHIESFNGIGDLLKPGTIQAELKISGLKALGVMVDANSDPESRWTNIRERVKETIPEVPAQLPVDGLICQNRDGLKFGVWLMPDNRSHGMLETFLRFFVPPDGQSLWGFVQAHCKDAKIRQQAPYKDGHIDKVNVHAWLALQDPPGQSLHLAVLAKTLKVGSPYSDRFVNWFRTLYGL